MAHFFHNARPDGDLVLVYACQLKDGRDYTLTIGRCSGEIHSACPLERRRERAVRRHVSPSPRRVVRPQPQPEPEVGRWDHERWERRRNYPSDDDEAARDMRIPERDAYGWDGDTHARSPRY